MGFGRDLNAGDYRCIGSGDFGLDGVLGKGNNKSGYWILNTEGWEELVFLIGVVCIWIAFDSDLDDTYRACYVGIRDRDAVMCACNLHFYEAFGHEANA